MYHIGDKTLPLWTLSIVIKPNSATHRTGCSVCIGFLWNWINVNTLSQKMSEPKDKQFILLCKSACGTGTVCALMWRGKVMGHLCCFQGNGRVSHQTRVLDTPMNPLDRMNRKRAVTHTAAGRWRDPNRDNTVKAPWSRPTVNNPIGHYY